MPRVPEASLSIQHSHFCGKSRPHIITGRNVTVLGEDGLLLWLQQQMQPDTWALKGLYGARAVKCCSVLLFVLVI